MLDVVDDLRDPAYTGTNRCWPCTLLNVVVVTAVAGAVALVGIWIDLAATAAAVGVAIAAVGLALVALRGYVVPGTPRFAPRLVEPLPVSFGHDPDDTPVGADSDALAVAADPEALIARLVEADVVVAEGDALRLADDVREDWEAAMATRRGRSADDLAGDLAEAVPFEAEVTALDGWFDVVGEREASLSRPVAIAEVAAVDVLTDRGLDHDTAAAAATPMRTFAAVCPACGGPVAETTLRNCCGGPGGVYADPETPVLACEDCETVVAEF